MPAASRAAAGRAAASQAWARHPAVVGLPGSWAAPDPAPLGQPVLGTLPRPDRMQPYGCSPAGCGSAGCWHAGICMQMDVCVYSPVKNASGRNAANNSRYTVCDLPL